MVDKVESFEWGDKSTYELSQPISGHHEKHEGNLRVNDLNIFQDITKNVKETRSIGVIYRL